MVKKKISEFNHNIVPSTDADGSLNLFDLNNPDINLFNAIDDELIKVSGSKILIYTYEHDENYDDLFDERRHKAINPIPKIVWGHYDPRALEENLSEFGIEITNDQMFTFNKAYLESAIGGPLKAGDVIKPSFQNLFYEVFEVQEDNFAAYGVYHLIASARVLRDVPEVFPEGQLPSISMLKGKHSYTSYKLSQGTSVTLAPEDSYTPAQVSWILENANTLLFSRDSSKEFRKQFINDSREGVNYGLYTNFTSITQKERDTYGAGIEQYLAKKSDGSYYQIGGQDEFLAKFWDKDWLHARIRTFPDHVEGARGPGFHQKDSGLTYILMDSCNLYPIDVLTGNENPFANEGAWRESMLGVIEFVRAQMDANIKIIVRCINNHIQYPDYIANPHEWYQYDGTDALDRNLGQGGLSELTIDCHAGSPPLNEWLYSLRTILRGAQEGKLMLGSWHTDEVDLEQRMFNWCSYALVHNPDTTHFRQYKTGNFSPSPPLIFPEDNEDLGKPLNAPHSMFEGKDTTEQMVFTREFDSGYAVVFNFTLGTIDLPSKYSSYKIVGLNTDVALNTDGTTNGTITYNEGSSTTIGAFRGLMLRR